MTSPSTVSSASRQITDGQPFTTQETWEPVKISRQKIALPLPIYQRKQGFDIYANQDTFKRTR